MLSESIYLKNLIIIITEFSTFPFSIKNKFVKIKIYINLLLPEFIFFQV